MQRRDNEKQEEHWMYQLKMLRRRKPLNLKRIPSLLLANIFSRQTGRTMMRISRISYKYYRLIAQILSKMKRFIVFERVQQRFDWGQITDFLDAPLYNNSLGRKRTFRDWVDYLLPMIDYEKLKELDNELGQELEQLYLNKGRHDLNTFDLSSIPPANLHAIINRMSFLGAIRLRQGNRFCCSQVDTAMVQYYPASVMFGPLKKKIKRFRDAFRSEPTINGNCRSIIDSRFARYPLTPTPSSSFLREYNQIPPRLEELTSIEERLKKVERRRLSKEWRYLGYIPPSKSISPKWDPRKINGPYWA